MGIFSRLFVWFLNLVFGPRAGTLINALTEDPVGDIAQRQYEDDRKSQRTDAIVTAFKSSATPVHGAVNYGELKWDSYDRAVETTDQFVFYRGPSPCGA